MTRMTDSFIQPRWWWWWWINQIDRMTVHSISVHFDSFGKNRPVSFFPTHTHRHTKRAHFLVSTRITTSCQGQSLFIPVYCICIFSCSQDDDNINNCLNNLVHLTATPAKIKWNLKKINQSKKPVTFLDRVMHTNPHCPIWDSKSKHNNKITNIVTLCVCRWLDHRHTSNFSHNCSISFEWMNEWLCVECVCRWLSMDNACEWVFKVFKFSIYHTQWQQ